MKSEVMKSSFSAQFTRFVCSLGIGSMLLLLPACKTDVLPPVVTETPDFYLKGTIEGQTLDIAGGQDDYYMYTSYENGEKNVLSFVGELAKTKCKDCSEALKIEIRNKEVTDVTSVINPEESLLPDDYKYRYRRAEGNIFKIAFSSEGPNNSNETFFWNFGDGTTSTEANPVHEYTDESEAYEVCLEVVNANNVSTNICNQIRLDQTHCMAAFIHNLRPEYGNYVEFRSETIGIEPIRYLWEFGDGVQATLNNPGYYYADDSLYTACLTIVDEHGCISTYCKNIATEPDIPEGNFSYEIESVTVPPDTLALSQVTVSWRDSNGKFYRSDREAQPSFESFTILSSENYEMNEAGEKTQRLKVRFSCRVFGEGDYLDLKDVEGYFGVAYR